MIRRYRQVDVFAHAPYCGNPLAVVLDGQELTAQEMARFTRWTNLSEATFVLPPTHPEADYRVRIFTSATPTADRAGKAELPFAGHPTLGTCHVWLDAGGISKSEFIMQECGAGLVPIQRAPGTLAFAVPPLKRSGPVEEALLGRIAGMLRIDRSEIADAAWVDNGPGWVAVLLESAERVLMLEPAFVDLDLGVVGVYPKGSDPAIEVRAFFPRNGSTTEDPVTGSLNGSVAAWLLASGRVTAPYTASQGTALGRQGRVHISTDAAGRIWVGGTTITRIAGHVEL